MGVLNAGDPMNRTPPETAPPTPSAWPEPGEGRVVFLLDAASALEIRILRDWIAAHRPEGLDESAVDAIPIPSSRRPNRGGGDLARLEVAMSDRDSVLLTPLSDFRRARSSARNRPAKPTDQLTCELL